MCLLVLMCTYYCLGTVECHACTWYGGSTITMLLVIRWCVINGVETIELWNVTHARGMVDRRLQC